MKAIILLALFCVVACNQQENTFIDTRDSKKYKITKIGEQVWMAENLNYEVEGSKCYNDSISYCGKYGRLYNWNTAMKACPSGWHLPSNEEWDKLYRYADGTSGTESPYRSKMAGKYLKSTSGWNESGNGEDKFGFYAIPGGFGNSDGLFGNVSNLGYWWSSASEYSSDSAYSRGIYYYYEDAYWGYDGKDDFLFSVRCVGD
ncbi:MAG: fibrobacter succinogenes major paralogous domain-containing protein [Fibromonadaceae bacterium]|jgi:uncharacterized protein (TIGR02145 family)|nr:fibrobacter succinogenes major paralogous domain-containing protein [Fibromonadaceae bacterium]